MKLLTLCLAMMFSTLAYADDAPPADPPATPPPVEKPAEPPAEPPKKEEDEPPADEGDKGDGKPPPDDLLTAAIAEKARLEAELEALKSSDDGNIFEQNAILKSELEDAQKLQEMAVENAGLKSKLEGIKRETIIKSLNLTEKMTAWADGLTFEQLEEFATMTPRRKTILDVKNPAGEESSTITKFKEEQETSRIM